MKQQKGFTLIELIITIAILTILATVSVSNFREGERSRRVALASDAAINAVRNAQNMTLTAKQIASSTCANKGPKSYIANIEYSAQIVIYGEDNCGNFYAVETFKLPVNAAVKANSLTVNGSPVGELQIKFSTPFAGMSISTDPNLGTGPFNSFISAEIGIELTDASRFKTVLIDGVSGKIGE